jgi:ornithine decarboxylase
MTTKIATGAAPVLVSTSISQPQLFRNTSGALVFHGTADELVGEMRPADPVHIMRLDRIEAAGREFIAGFSGAPMYAVKCNPDKAVIQSLYRSGIRAFDVASIGEVRLVKKLAPKAKLYFMHPIKSREAIFESYFTHGVRRFVLDTQAELFKIIQETRMAGDVELFVRIMVNNSHAALALSGKFGASLDEAVELLKACRPVCTRLGVSFHVGSQCMNPVAYRDAIAQVAELASVSGVKIDVLDVGGGFPVAYDGMTPPPLADYFAEIKEAITDHNLQDLELLAEPGRALVGRGMSLIARVELRKDHADGLHTLHLNDGTYGGLQEGAKWQGIRYPVRQAGRKSDDAAELLGFRLAGPTCDSLDMMPGPYMLPADIGEGDWIEIEQHGAYGLCTRTIFNGFTKFDKVFLKD